MLRALIASLLVSICCFLPHAAEAQARKFARDRDLLSLHYDHAPDRDDGHSAAADRTILQTLFGKNWIRKHVVAVSGAYGKNAKHFNPKSDAVMDAAWNDCGGWLAAHANHEAVAATLAARWLRTLEAGGDVWVKEGGQSDLTAAAVKRIREASSEIDTMSRIHLVQHADWNENQTTDKALAYVHTHCDYIRIRDANAYLNRTHGNQEFAQAAREHSVYGKAWKAAFAYYDPNRRLDFSDTGELMHILELGELGIDDFQQRFLGKPDQERRAP